MESQEYKTGHTALGCVGQILALCGLVATSNGGVVFFCLALGLASTAWIFGWRPTGWKQPPRKAPPVPIPGTEHAPPKPSSATQGKAHPLNEEWNSWGDSDAQQVETNEPQRSAPPASAHREATQVKPARSGLPWFPAEDEQLSIARTKRVSEQILVEHHGRSAGAIKSRLTKHEEPGFLHATQHHRVPGRQSEPWLDWESAYLRRALDQGIRPEEIAKKLGRAAALV